MSTPPTLTELSLGRGVQPSIMAFMRSHGAFEGYPNAPSSPKDRRVQERMRGVLWGVKGRS